MSNFRNPILLTTMLVSILSLNLSCKKTTASPPVSTTPGNPNDLDSVITPGVDPSVAETIGFFLDDWTSKSFTAPEFNDHAIASSPTIVLTIDPSSIITKIAPSVFGQNAVFWMGPVNSEPLFINPVNDLKPHVLRFPGGSASDAYFWNQPQGQNPSDAPATIMDKDANLVAPGYNYGMSNQNWICSLDNYYDMLSQTQNQGLITINYGYARYGTSTNPVAAAAHLAADWVRYDHGRTKYWEIGNENFGDWEWGYRIDLTKNKDGQDEYLTGALYAKHFKIFADSMRQAASETGHPIYIGAVTVEAPANESWQTNTLKTWNAGMMAGILDVADYYVVHNYFTPYNTNSSATDVLNAATTVPAQMMGYLPSTITSYGASIKPIVLDEWNMFAVNSQQMVSNTSGAFAVLVLSELMKNKFGLGARWDLLNGWSNGDDMGLFSAGDEPGVSKWNPRPSFYYMYIYKKFLGDRLVSTSLSNNSTLMAYSTTFSSGQINATLVNTGSAAQTVQVKLKNFHTGSRFYWYDLESGTTLNDFARQVFVNGEGPSGSAGGPSDYASIKPYSSLTQNGIIVKVPPLGMISLVIDKK